MIFMFALLSVSFFLLWRHGSEGRMFFRDPISAKPSEPNEMNLLRICDVHNIPVATNIATAEVLIHGLEHGDLDWRTILNPQH